MCGSELLEAEPGLLVRSELSPYVALNGKVATIVCKNQSGVEYVFNMIVSTMKQSGVWDKIVGTIDNVSKTIEGHIRKSTRSRCILHSLRHVTDYTWRG